ncbi:chorismate mutase [Simkania sp.]|uniref:chorismate mutase n=1 Tax=Simkania sp. TaxID=34094 RepID=UPI003B52DEAE
MRKFILFLLLSMGSISAEEIVNLDLLRKELDIIDQNIVSLFALRYQVVKQVATYKKQHNIPVYEPKREAEEIKKLGELAQNYKIDPDVIEQIFQIYITYCRESETQLSK